MTSGSSLGFGLECDILKLYSEFPLVKKGSKNDFFLTPSLCVMFIFCFYEVLILYSRDEYCPFKGQADTLGNAVEGEERTFMVLCSL